MLEWKPWRVKDGTFWELYQSDIWLGSVYKADEAYKIACTHSGGRSMPQKFSSIKEAANKLLEMVT